MQRILILLFVCMVFNATHLLAQVPENISVPYPVKPDFSGTHSPESVCNFAGTFQLGASGVNTQSNDLNLNQIFLCFGDSLFINHNGDADISGDPIPATPGGIGWAFFDCNPTIVGDNLQTVITDPCLTPGGANGIWVYTGTNPEGDAWFFNTGILQNNFNAGQPVELFFAPITLDAFSSIGFESTQVGFPAGPCVNVNTAVAFSVVYLNAITESGISTNFGNDCLGKFRIQGGYPEFEPTAVYTINIALKSNPNVKALIQTPSVSQLYHSADVIFSAPQPGVYVVTVEDGISCGHTFEITMGTCNATDNVVLSFPQVTAPPGSNICIPVTVENFNSVAASFSMTWDPTILQYTGFNNADPSIDGFTASNFNTQNITLGQLGVSVFDNNPVGAPIVIANGGTLFSVCFDVIGPLDECTTLGFTNTPTPVIIENNVGLIQAVTADTGQACVGFKPLACVLEIDTLCFGNALIKVRPSGGIAPYEVTIEKLVTGPTSQGIVPNEGGLYIPMNSSTNGDFRISVIDNNGNGDTVVILLNLNIQSLGAALNLTGLPTCNGLKDGSVIAEVFIGTTSITNPGPNISFAWSGPGGPHPATQTLSGIGAGTYTLIVTDSQTGCSASASGTLGQPTPVNRFTFSTTPADCSGVCNGTINYVPEGGTKYPGGNYDYVWTYSPDGNPANAISDAIGQDSLITLTNRCAGTYFVTITDQNGCTFTDNIIITNLRTVVIDTTSIINIGCNGATNGEICVQVIETPASGNANYNFFWSPPGFTQTSGSVVTSCYSGLPANSYDVLAVGTVSGCIASATFVVTEPTPIVAVATITTNPLCDQPTSGRIEIRGTGGTATVDPASYDYLWNTGDSTRLIENLSQGTYCATVTDLNGCTDTICVTLTIPTPPVISALDSTQVKCGNDGCLTVTVAGNNLTYTWSNIDGSLILTGPENSVCGLNGGDYILNIKDQGGCSTTDTFTLASKAPLSLSDTTFVEPTCAGLSNGIISVAATGGNGGYTFVWKPTGATGPILLNAAAGCDTLIVRDIENCSLTAILCLTEPPAITNVFDTTFIKNVSCFGICDGEASPITNYSDGSSGSFIFQWADLVTDSNRVNLCAGLNVVTISDLNGCFLIDSVTLTSPTAVSAFIEQIDSVSCFGGSDGRIGIGGEGGNGIPYQYQWSPNTNNSNNTPIVNNLSAGIYAVTITDAKGCTGVSSFTVAQPGQIVLAVDNATSIPPTCAGGNDGVIGLSIVGGNTGAFTYSWSNGTSTVGTTNPLENQPAGVYAVTVTDAEGCTGLLENILLEQPDAIFGRLDTLDEIQCFGDQIILSVDTIFGGKGGPYQYSVDNGVTLNPTFPISIGGGIHYVSYFDQTGTCSFTDTINIPEPAQIEIAFNPISVELELGDSLQLNPIFTGIIEDSIATFAWSPATRLLNLPSLRPTVYTFESQKYFLSVTDKKGCTGIGSIQINIDPNRNVYIPNVFIPGNPTGLNDHFNAWIGKGVEKVNSLQVFNRWGEKMYERVNFLPENQPSEGWDGRFRGEYVQPAVYVYAIEVSFLDGRVLVYRGDVTIFR